MKILLVEDDKFFREFYSEKLRERNIKVETAENGEVGLAIIQAFTPDLILLDIIMPKKDGFEVLKELGQKHLLQKIPVLVFSTLGQEKDIERARLLGARGYVNKSFFDFENLYNKIISVANK